MNMTQILLIILIILVIVLFFMIIKIKNENVKDDFNNIKFDIIKEILNQNSDNREQISKNIVEFKDNIRNLLFEDINKLGDLVEKKLDTSNILDKDIKDGINGFKENIRENITKDLLNLSEKVELKVKDGFQTTDNSVKEVIQRLTKIDTAQKNIEKLSQEVVELQKILSDKKSRGSFGEMRLEQVLNNIYSDTGLYKMQYKLSNNKIVDSVVYINDKEKIVSIDSKFPLDNYNKDKKLFIKDVKKHINDISDKYIIEGETLNTAMMFIPSESIFMDIIENYENEILNYAYLNKVFIVSQRTLMIYISTMNLASINYRKNKNASLIIKSLSELSIEFERNSKRWEDLNLEFNKLEKKFKEVSITTNKIIKKFENINIMNKEEI